MRSGRGVQKKLIIVGHRCNEMSSRLPLFFLADAIMVQEEVIKQDASNTRARHNVSKDGGSNAQACRA